MTDRVLLTGISGFIGLHVALALLQAGYLVRGSLRDRRRAPAIRAALARAGADTARLELVGLDLLDDGGWDAAAAGCRYLQHVASPLTLRMPADRDELIRPAVEGTRRALGAALRAGVERLVVTSSAAAITSGHPPERTRFGAADWSRTTGPGVSAYSESKTRAELEAWSLAEEAGRRADLATINPAVVLGPLLDDDPGTSVELVRRLLDGSIPAVPRLAIGIADVRDVAALHLAAMRDPGARGQRLPVAAGSLMLIAIARQLRRELLGRRGIPRLELPDWLTRFVAVFDRDLRDNIGGLGVVRTLDSGRAEALLGRPLLPPATAIAATAQSLIARGLV